MRVAWFRAASSQPSDTSAPTSDVIAALPSDIHVDLVTEAQAHDFVIAHAQRPWDVCVYEPRTTRASDFIWGYLFHYPGVLMLQDASLHNSRVRTFERHRRHPEYAAEFNFNHGHPPRGAAKSFPRGSWPMLRAPILASTLVVTQDVEFGAHLKATYPTARMRHVPAWAAGPLTLPDPVEPDHSLPVRVSVVGGRRERLAPIVEQARTMGISVTLVGNPGEGDIEPAADVIVAVDSPAGSANLAVAMGAMACGKAVVVLEREATAAWPAIDPQTWRSRDALNSSEPIVVSLDPRDEAHSLLLALRHLAQDRTRRLALGAAARAWWLAHATPAHAAPAWARILEEAHNTAPSPLPADWPTHLRADDVDRTRAIAEEFLIDPERLGYRVSQG